MDNFFEGAFGVASIIFAILVALLMLWPVITSILEHIPKKQDELIKTIKEKEKQIDELSKQINDLEGKQKTDITSSFLYKEILTDRDNLRSKLEQTEFEKSLLQDKIADLIAQLRIAEIKAEKSVLTSTKTKSTSFIESSEIQKELRFKLSQAESEILSCQDKIAELTEKLRIAEINDEKSNSEMISCKDQIKELIDAQENTRFIYREGLEQLRRLFSPPSFPLEELLQRVNDGKLSNAFESDLRLKEVTVIADIESKKESHTDAYHVTLTSCECEDFRCRKKPCKHMLYLAYVFGVLQINQIYCHRHFQPTIEEASNSAALLISIEDEKRKLKKREEDLKKDHDKKIEHFMKEYEKQVETMKGEYDKQVESLQKEHDKLDQEKTLVANIDEIIQKKCEGYPQLAAIMADLLTAYYENSAFHLENKKNPAYTEAQRIRELKKDTAAIIAEKKEIEYKLEYLKLLYPNIEDVFDSGYDAEYSLELETEDNTDRTRLFLSHEEYASLSTAERNQLALDRYVENRKSKWQIGRDYEMYVGYLYESQGYRMQYTGILKKLEDMGRDLIATNREETLIIQCKNWSKEKVIHEKHIFQLFGTVVLYNIEHPDNPATGVFISSTNLSETAEKIAHELNISIVFKEIGEFPRIKCNINRTTGEKIYHLPFDQQYDSTVIDKNSGEFYAFTVQEAEDRGFRRAFRHYAS